MTSNHETPATPSANRGGTSAPAALHAGDEMLTLSEVATLLRVPEATIRYWRHRGIGPHSFRLGRSVRYWRTDLTTWLDEQTQADQPGH